MIKKLGIGCGLLVLLAGCAAPPPASLPATPTATLTPLPTAIPAATMAPVTTLRVGETASLQVAGRTGEIRITVQSAEEYQRTSFSTPKPGTTFVAVVIRYDNNLDEAIQVSESRWQMAGADGVRRSGTTPARDDWLRVSAVPPGTFIVGSITFEVPPGPLQLFYVPTSASGRIFIWQVR